MDWWWNVGGSADTQWDHLAPRVVRKCQQKRGSVRRGQVPPKAGQLQLCPQQPGGGPCHRLQGPPRRALREEHPSLWFIQGERQKEPIKVILG